jgi:hypothetical protein
MELVNDRANQTCGRVLEQQREQNGGIGRQLIQR